jgi:hypothetical protein
MPRNSHVGRALSPALLLLFAQLAFADARYMIDYVLPRGGSRGATVDVEFRGMSLENPQEVLFYEPGIKASAFVPLAKPGEGFKAKFQIAPDCPLGEHVLRVRTATALSDAVTFWVGPFPTVLESETKVGENDTIEKAKPIRLNSTVEGQILPGQDQDIDMYVVAMLKGQRLSVEVEAARLGTLHTNGENDLAVRILDAKGKEIARNDDSALYVQDPVLSILTADAGPYYIEIKQQIFYPPRQAWYRAHIGTFTRPTALYPAGGQAGTTLEARILGDPMGERTERITLPKQPGNFSYFAGAAGEKPPSPNILRVSPYPNALWDGAPVATQLPVALNGILTKPGEAQTFSFAAKKSQAWHIRVYSRTLGAPVDPKIWIQAAGNPKHILEADDSKLTDLGYPSSRGTWYIKDQQDPSVIFKPPTDGDYVLGVEDTTGAAGPDHVYRVEIEPVRDTIYTHVTTGDAYQIPRLTGFIIPQGNRWTLDVQLAQGLGNNYKGEVELEAVGLPKGVTMIAPKYAKGVNRLPVQFVAAPDAQPGAALIQLLARSTDKSNPIETATRQGFALTNRGGELPWHFVFLDRFALAVVQAAPFHIELEQPAIPLTQSGEMLLKAKLIRHGDFKGPVEIIPDWLPPGVSKGGVETIAEGKDEATFRIQANDKAAPGTYRIAMSASTQGGDGYSGVGRIRVSSAFVDLKVSEPYVTIDLQRGAVERGKTAKITGVLHQKNPFPGEATVTLQQLPKGIQIKDPLPRITSKDIEVTFQIEASPDALAGLYKGISCEVALTVEGQTIRQHTGSGVIRIDAAKTLEAGR